MAQLLEIMKAVITLLPLAVQFIQGIEQAIPQSGQGAAKLALVKNALGAAYQSAGVATATFDQIWPPLKSAIDGVVGIFNAVGLFKKA